MGKSNLVVSVFTWRLCGSFVLMLIRGSYQCHGWSVIPWLLYWHIPVLEEIDNWVTRPPFLPILNYMTQKNIIPNTQVALISIFQWIPRYISLTHFPDLWRWVTIFTPVKHGDVLVAVGGETQSSSLSPLTIPWALEHSSRSTTSLCNT